MDQICASSVRRGNTVLCVLSVFQENSGLETMTMRRCVMIVELDFTKRIQGRQHAFLAFLDGTNI
jgi:hypothetical protein